MSILMGLARDERQRAKELRRLGLNKLAEEADEKAENLEKAYDEIPYEERRDRG